MPHYSISVSSQIEHSVADGSATHVVNTSLLVTVAAPEQAALQPSCPILVVSYLISVISAVIDALLCDWVLLLLSQTDTPTWSDQSYFNWVKIWFCSHFVQHAWLNLPHQFDQPQQRSETQKSAAVVYSTSAALQTVVCNRGFAPTGHDSLWPPPPPCSRSFSNKDSFPEMLRAFLGKTRKSLSGTAGGGVSAAVK